MGDKTFRIATWNVNECVGVTCDLDNQKTSESINYEYLNNVVDLINQDNLDVVCFQEFPITISGKKQLINLIKENTDLRYSVEIATSDSYLFNGGTIGVAIFSKYKIKDAYITKFINPNLTKVSSSGKVYHSFDKGIILIKIEINNKFYNIITGHAIAFAPFGKTEFDHKESYQPLEILIDKYYKENLIVAGDFNCDKIYELIPSINEKVRDVVNTTTTYGFYEKRGEVQMDYILLSNSVEYSNFHKLDNFSDHYVCVVDICEK